MLVEGTTGPDSELFNYTFVVQKISVQVLISAAPLFKAYMRSFRSRRKNISSGLKKKTKFRGNSF